MDNEQQKKSSGFEAGTQQNGLVDQAKHVAAVVADKVGEQVTHGIEEKRDVAVQKIGGVAEAVRWGSKALKDIVPLGAVSQKAADRIENVATFFDNKQVGDIVRDVERFARRESAIFLGAAFALGLIGGRFLKSSGHRSEELDGGMRMSGGYREGFRGRRDEMYDDIYDGVDGSYDDYGRETYAAPITARTGYAGTPDTGRAGGAIPSTRSTQPTPTRTQATSSSSMGSSNTGSTNTTSSTRSTTGSIKPTPIVNASPTPTASATSTKPRNGSAGS